MVLNQLFEEDFGDNEQQACRDNRDYEQRQQEQQSQTTQQSSTHTRLANEQPISNFEFFEFIGQISGVLIDFLHLLGVLFVGLLHSGNQLLVREQSRRYKILLVRQKTKLTLSQKV